jgi:hypothetical protein
MTRDGADVRPEEAQVKPTIGRRGMVAAAWAMVAAVVLRKRETSVEATSGGGADGTLVMGSNGASPNTSTATTLMLSASNFMHGEFYVFDSTGFQGTGTPNIVGVTAVGRGTSAGVVGMQNLGVPSGYPTTLNAGVYGTSFAAAGRGVVGHHLGGGTGVVGQAATGGIGVQGALPATNTGNGIAVYGLNYSSVTGGSPGAGGFGVYGLSANGHGLVGATASAGGAAVVGATNGVAGAYAGAFYGPVVVSGDFTVLGAKSAAVPHPDGSRRRLYCVESPESWFEDFGKSRLECGEAIVPIDPDFAAVTEMHDYHVFVTPNEDHDLRVSDQTPTQFTVRAKDPKAAGRFSWRVVAKRRDIPGDRFSKVAAPAEPTLPDPGVPRS